MITVSIITICLNSREHIAQTLESVARQDYPCIEHIVVDGGSTDGTLDIIRLHAEKDSRIRMVSGRDAGISEAMNKGLGLATGGIVAFLHSDDQYTHERVVSSVVDALCAAPGAHWLTGGLIEVDKAGRKLRLLPVRKFSLRRLLWNNIVYHPATFVRNEAFMKVGGFDLTLRYAMDYDLWLRLASIAHPVLLDQPLACFRVHQGSRSSANRLATLEEEYTVRKRYMKGGVSRWLHGCHQVARRLSTQWESDARKE
jgi:glycosyltransferase involved in cell wall biosynthesis